MGSRTEAQWDALTLDLGSSLRLTPSEPVLSLHRAPKEYEVTGFISIYFILPGVQIFFILINF